MRVLNIAVVAAFSAASPSRTRTGRKKPGLQAIQRDPSGEGRRRAR